MGVVRAHNEDIALYPKATFYYARTSEECSLKSNFASMKRQAPRLRPILKKINRKLGELL